MPEGRFVPVYYEDMLEHHAAVWDDHRLRGVWLLLLTIHDKAWPSPGDLPRDISVRTAQELADAGVVELLPKHRFKVRGVDAKRNAQRNAASNAAGSRWGNAKAMPTKPDHTKTKPNQTKLEIRNGAESSVPREVNGSAEATHLRAIKVTDEEGVPDFLRVVNP